MVEERTPAGLYAAGYVYGGGFEPLSVTQDLDGVARLETACYLFDAHSCERQSIDAAGAVGAAMRYGYAGGNPVMNADPSGMEFSVGGMLSEIRLLAGWPDPLTMNTSGC